MVSLLIAFVPVVDVLLLESIESEQKEPKRPLNLTKDQSLAYAKAKGLVPLKSRQDNMRTFISKDMYDPEKLESDVNILEEISTNISDDGTFEVSTQTLPALKEIFSVTMIEPKVGTQIVLGRTGRGWQFEKDGKKTWMNPSFSAERGNSRPHAKIVGKYGDLKRDNSGGKASFLALPRFLRSRFGVFADKPLSQSYRMLRAAECYEQIGKETETIEQRIRIANERFDKKMKIADFRNAKGKSFAELSAQEKDFIRHRMKGSFGIYGFSSENEAITFFEAAKITDTNFEMTFFAGAMGADGKLVLEGVARPGG